MCLLYTFLPKMSNIIDLYTKIFLQYRGKMLEKKVVKEYTICKFEIVTNR